MATELNLLNVHLYAASVELDNLRQNMKKGTRVFLLNEGELKEYAKIGFPENSRNDAEYWDFVRRITNIEKFNGVGFYNGLLTVSNY